MSDEDEWRAALHDDRRTHADCYRHDYRSNTRGGGTCTGCGDSIDREEM